MAPGQDNFFPLVFLHLPRLPTLPSWEEELLSLMESSGFLTSLWVQPIKRFSRKQEAVGGENMSYLFFVE